MKKLITISIVISTVLVLHGCGDFLEAKKEIGANASDVLANVEEGF